VPFTLVHTGKYGTKDKLKIQTIHKLNTIPKKQTTQNTADQNYSGLRHSVGKRGGLILQRSRVHAGHVGREWGNLCFCITVLQRNAYFDNSCNRGHTWTKPLARFIVSRQSGTLDQLMSSYFPSAAGPVSGLAGWVSAAGTREGDYVACPASAPSLRLNHTELWHRFSTVGTEMVITKSGRHVFASLYVDM